MIIELTLLIVFLFINSLQIIGFYTATRFEYLHGSETLIDEDSKMILWQVKWYANLFLGKFWSKPVCDCPPCMSGLHSLWIWIPIYYFMPFEFHLLYVHALYILALCGLNSLIVSKFEL
jgi:hypothetical protein